MPNPTTLAAQPALKLEVQPSELTLDLGQPATGRLLILAHNPDPAALSLATLVPLASAGITATIAQPPATTSGDLVWAVDVTADQTAASPAKLVFTLTYAGTGRTAPPAIVSVTATINPPPPLTASVLKAVLLPAEGSVEGDTPLDTVLKIDNPSRQAAHVTHVRVIAPERYVCLGEPPLKPSIRAECRTQAPPDGTISPGGTLAIPLLLVAKSALPGSYPLVIGFDATLDGLSLGAQPLFAQGKLSLEVRGVSDALQLVGIPSLLLAPGVLAILTGIAAWGLFAGQKAVDLKQVPILLVIAVVLSFGAALLYPILTERYLGVRRDYLLGYDMRDVVYVWVGSMAVGGLFGGVPGLSVWIVRAVQRHCQRLLPSPTDNALNVLEKLDRHHADFLLPAWQSANPGANPQFMLELPFGDAGAGNRWLVQRAAVRPGNQAGTQGRIARIRAALEVQPSDIARLFKEIRDGKKAGEVLVDWERDPELGPQAFPTANYHPVNGNRTFVFLPNPNP
ncbi:MAG: hypothetical protein ABSC06_11925 [Rhodopila sp.]